MDGLSHQPPQYLPLHEDSFILTVPTLQNKRTPLLQDWKENEGVKSTCFRVKVWKWVKLAINVNECSLFSDSQLQNFLDCLSTCHRLCQSLLGVVKLQHMSQIILWFTGCSNSAWADLTLLPCEQKWAVDVPLSPPFLIMWYLNSTVAKGLSPKYHKIASSQTQY